MKEEIIELKIRKWCNEDNERQPTEFTVTVDGKVVVWEMSKDVSLTALQAVLNRLA